MADSTVFDDDPVAVYLSEIGKVARLTEDQELELARRVLAGDEEAGKTLVEANLAMVVSVAQRYSRADVHVLDLVVKGNEGLLIALQTFPNCLNERFSTHAAKCVDRAIAQAAAGT